MTATGLEPQKPEPVTGKRQAFWEELNKVFFLKSTEGRGKWLKTVTVVISGQWDFSFLQSFFSFLFFFFDWCYCIIWDFQENAEPWQR